MNFKKRLSTYSHVGLVSNLFVAYISLDLFSAKFCRLASVHSL